ncbi:unnamed protein product [Prorocentrum cordatum]|uniref:Uncharacterized protein n=1 Tax=Prorocentrum cordatum TaxID=2364126 RepID=A0ABN9V4Z1_9DINO|nr:unnamed protein product [Polarella glacialis]
MGVRHAGALGRQGRAVEGVDADVDEFGRKKRRKKGAQKPAPSVGSPSAADTAKDGAPAAADGPGEDAPGGACERPGRGAKGMSEKHKAALERLHARRPKKAYEEFFQRLRASMAPCAAPAAACLPQHTAVAASGAVPEAAASGAAGGAVPPPMLPPPAALQAAAMAPQPPQQAAAAAAAAWAANRAALAQLNAAVAAGDAAAIQAVKERGAPWAGAERAEPAEGGPSGSAERSPVPALLLVTLPSCAALFAEAAIAAARKAPPHGVGRLLAKSGRLGSLARGVDVRRFGKSSLGVELKVVQAYLNKVKGAFTKNWERGGFR